MSHSSNFIPLSHSNNYKPLELPDCIHLSEHCRCKILRVGGCIGKDCSFKQSTAEAKESKSVRKHRINSLSLDKQKKIATVYYEGEMPWKDGLERERLE